MPRKNGTGPMGMGPKTGRGAGDCKEEGTFQKTPFRQGCGEGLGRGKRCGRGFCGTEPRRRGMGYHVPEMKNTEILENSLNQKEQLQNRIQCLENELDDAQKQLETLES